MTDLVLRDVTVCYASDPALHHVDLRLPFGEVIALMGPNGAGKSTLLRAILGWLPLTTGRISIDDGPLARERIAYLGQRRAQQDAMPLDVRAVVEMGRYPRVGMWRRFTAEDHAAVDGAIHEMGLERQSHQRFADLSGGQAQRVLLARALATGADIFLLDEPFAGLDPAASAHLLEALASWGRQDRLVLVVVHDLELVRRHFNRVVLINRHLIGTGAPQDILTPAAIASCFTVTSLAQEHGHG